MDFRTMKGGNTLHTTLKMHMELRPPLGNTCKRTSERSWRFGQICLMVILACPKWQEVKPRENSFISTEWQATALREEIVLQFSANS